LPVQATCTSLKRNLPGTKGREVLLSPSLPSSGGRKTNGWLYGQGFAVRLKSNSFSAFSRHYLKDG